MKKIFEVRTQDPDGEHCQKITLFELTDEERNEIDEMGDERDIREYLGLPRYNDSEYIIPAGAGYSDYSFEIIGKIAKTVEAFGYNI